MIPATLFFLVAFLLLALTRSLLLARYEIQVSTFGAATAGALLVSKVVLVADHLRFVDRFPHKPLVYNIAWKTVIYFCASFVARYLEFLIGFWRSEGSITAANERIFEEIVWSHFWLVQLWLFVLLLIYASLHELIRAVGRERAFAVFFRESRSASPHP